MHPLSQRADKSKRIRKRTLPSMSKLDQSRRASGNDDKGDNETEIDTSDSTAVEDENDDDFIRDSRSTAESEDEFGSESETDESPIPAKKTRKPGYPTFEGTTSEDDSDDSDNDSCNDDNGITVAQCVGKQNRQHSIIATWYIPT
jgi:hypothetical protein